MSSPDEVAVSEIELYRTDRAAWIVDAAPKMAAIIVLLEGSILATMWAGMKRDYQTAVWNILPVEARARIKAVRAKV